MPFLVFSQVWSRLPFRFGTAPVSTSVVTPVSVALTFKISPATPPLKIEWSTDCYEEHELMDTLAYNLWNAVEEGLEMAGVVLFIHTLLGYMVRGQGAQVGVAVEG